MTRLAYAVLRAGCILACVVTLSFGLVHLLPGDPARAIAGLQARPEDVAAVRTAFALDRPLHVQYTQYMARALRGDLGMSYQERRPVTAILGERIPVSLALTFAALFAECALGVAAGIAASVRRFRWALSPLAVLGSVPTFAVGIALQLVFAHLWGVLPLDGLGRGGSWGRSLILPVVALALPGAIAFGRVAREQLEGLLQSDGARTAYAKGASPMRVLCIHIVPQVAPSLLALVPPRVGSTLSGALVVETLFRLPGLGSLAAQAVFDGDLPVVVGVVLTTTSIVVVVQTAADVLATAVGGPKLNFPQAPRGTRPPSLRGPR